MSWFVYLFMFACWFIYLFVYSYLLHIHWSTGLFVYVLIYFYINSLPRPGPLGTNLSWDHLGSLLSRCWAHIAVALLVFQRRRGREPGKILHGLLRLVGCWEDRLVPFWKDFKANNSHFQLKGLNEFVSENRRRGFQFAVSFLLNASSPDDIINYKWMGAISPFTWTTPWCTSHGDLGVT